MENTSYNVTPEIAASEPETQFWLANEKGRKHAYNVICAMSLANVDIEKLVRAIKATLARFQLFRANYSFHNNAVQRHYGEHSIELLVAEPGASEAWFEAQCQAAFNLDEGPLCRLIISSTDTPQTAQVGLVFHHIIMDLASKDILKALIEQYYNGNICAFKNASDNYQAVTAEAQAWTTSAQGLQARNYWQDRVAGIQKHTQIAAKPATPQRLLGREVLPFSADLQVKLRAFAQQHNSTPYLILLTTYYWLLGRYANEHNFAVGVPLSLRRRAETENTVGCLISVAPIVGNLAANDSFTQALKKIRMAMLGAHRHPFYPSFVDGSGQTNGKLFCNGFTFEPPFTLNLQDAQCTPLPIHAREPQLQLFLRCWQDGEQVKGALEYDSSVFNAMFARRFNASLIKCLDQALARPDQPLATIDLLGDADRMLIERANRTTTDFAAPSHLMDLFESQVRKTPQATALKTPATTVSYQTLDEQSNQLAHALMREGVKRGDVVAVLFSRSVDMVNTLYAIQKAGAAYLPVDIELPADRIEYMLQQARCALAISNLPSLPALNSGVALKDYTTLTVASQQMPVTAPDVARQPDDTAYVIFTSGSTGQPKGVANSQEGVCNRLLWMQAELQLNAADIVLLKTPYNFDVSVWEFFWPLQTGATLAIAAADSHKDPYSITEQINQLGATVMHFVPAMLSAFLAANVEPSPSLRTVICSGEELKQEHQQKFFSRFPQTRLFNLYGPTEAAIDVTCWECDPDFRGPVLPIGRPIANTQIHIVDEQMTPVPVGVMGELLIGGVQVAKGYVGAETLTAKAFIDNPFGQGRLYKTGDYARWNEDGLIEFLGRKDFQVKLNGLRIELAEIENVLMSFDGVEIAVVTTIDIGNSKALLAYYSSADSAAIEEAALLAFLRSKLPGYMVPRYFYPLQGFVLTSSGKVDRKQLPAFQPPAAPSHGADESATTDYEKAVHTAWCEVLGKKQCSVNIGFFDAGGDSLGMMSVHAILKNRFHYNLSTLDMFAHPTIRALAGFLSTNGDHTTPINSGTSNRAKKMRQAMRKPKRAGF